MKTVCDVGSCTGCMACVDICPKNAIHIEDTMRSYNAVIEESACISCDMCHRVCQNNNPVSLEQPIYWRQGWSAEDDVRKKSSSGGVGAAIEKAFIKRGGVVCSCTFTHGEFCFSFAENEEQLQRFIGSKYVKSNPKGVYRKIKDFLKLGRCVLFVGLPCQAAAVKIFVGAKLQEKLYLVDLICHGSPSPQVLGTFLEQHGVSIDELEDIGFRSKSTFQLESNQKAIGIPGVLDKYSMAFLNSICYTENCYRCAYARIGRCSDITLGDSWGSELFKEEQRKGISLILCQSKKGMELLEKSNLDLKSVNIDNAIKSNHQLNHPSDMPKCRNEFFDEIESGEKFDKIVWRCLPKSSVKQFIKCILIKARIIDGGKSNYRIVVTFHI